MDSAQAKRHAAQEALSWVRDEMVIGLGTGSTAAIFIELLAERVRQGLRIRGVPTSKETGALARELGISLTDFEEIETCDLTVDGADEIDSSGDAIKGGGGALCREKIVARATQGPRVAVVHSEKVVDRLGRFPLPVEIIPFARAPAEKALRGLGAVTTLRQQGSRPFTTDNGNQLIDCAFGERDDWQHLADQLDRIPGVVCHGLFLGIFTDLVIGEPRGARILSFGQKNPTG